MSKIKITFLRFLLFTLKLRPLSILIPTLFITLVYAFISVGLYGVLIAIFSIDDVPVTGVLKGLLLISTLVITALALLISYIKAIVGIIKASNDAHST